MSFLELVPGLSEFFSGLDLSQSLKGWGRVSWGQSFDAVKRNYPQAVEVSGRKLELQPESSPPGRPYKITFAFDSSHQLSSVTLSFSGSRETADYAPIVEEFTRRLGAPVAITGDSTTWTRDQSQITISAQPEGGVVLSESV